MCARSRGRLRKSAEDAGVLPRPSWPSRGEADAIGFISIHGKRLPRAGATDSRSLNPSAANLLRTPADHPYASLPLQQQLLPAWYQCPPTAYWSGQQLAPAAFQPLELIVEGEEWGMERPASASSSSSSGSASSAPAPLASRRTRSAPLPSHRHRLHQRYLPCSPGAPAGPRQSLRAPFWPSTASPTQLQLQHAAPPASPFALPISPARSCNGALSGSGAAGEGPRTASPWLERLHSTRVSGLAVGKGGEGQGAAVVRSTGPADQCIVKVHTPTSAPCPRALCLARPHAAHCATCMSCTPPAPSTLP